MEIETNPTSEDTDEHIRPIVTNIKDRNAKERMELGESYMLWDLLLNFNNTQFKKRAIVKIAIKNKRSKQILDDLWLLPIGRKLTRITQGENKEEILVNRKKHRLILEAKWNRRNLSPDSDKGKKVANGFSKNSLKLNQKNTLYKEKITCSYNKKNKLGETTKYKNHYDEDKRKEGYNIERSKYIESLDEKLQIILQRLDKIEANRSRIGDKSIWKEIETPQSLLTVAKGERKNQLAVEDWLPLQRSQLQNIQPKQREGEEMEREKEEGGVFRTKEKRRVRAEIRKRIKKIEKKQGQSN
ncbi:1248_t:CDS:2 [Gigaspora margarita]|uniref:1248_t:CDS:1 n=1 Tax=Gigaspora margarita TaxID=4874 RepID=A0ABN7USA4_GIGMA|nr:1248_t:CDS:2 [Gigaspora margarita]